MAKQTNNSSEKKVKIKISRPGVHAKKFSGLKTSKLYKKKYVGQGK